MFFVWVNLTFLAELVHRRQGGHCGDGRVDEAVDGTERDGRRRARRAADMHIDPTRWVEGRGNWAKRYWPKG